jgi:hypothetical protein
VTDLVTFLRARLDEDQAAATRGLDPEDIPDAKADNVSALHDEYQFEKLVITKGRVLREVEAKRRILDRYEDALARITDPAESLYAARAQVKEYEYWTLPALALPYSDHSDYEEGWRP